MTRISLRSRLGAFAAGMLLAGTASARADHGSHFAGSYLSVVLSTNWGDSKQ
jgi:hypothetical protein